MEPRPPKPPRQAPGASQRPGPPSSTGGGQTPPRRPAYGQPPPAGPGNRPPAPEPAPGQPGYGQAPYPPQAPYGQPPAAPVYQQPGYGQQSYGHPGQRPGPGYPGFPPDPNTYLPDAQGYPQQHPPQYPLEPHPQHPGSAARAMGQPVTQGAWMGPLPDDDDTVRAGGYPVTNTAPYAAGAYPSGAGANGYADDPGDYAPSTGVYPAGVYRGNRNSRAARPKRRRSNGRQTQMVSAFAVGGLALFLLAIVVGYVVFGGDDAPATPVAGGIAAPTATLDPALAGGTTGGIAPTAAPADAGAGAANTDAQPTAIPADANAGVGTQPTAADSGQTTDASGSTLLEGGLYTGTIERLLPTVRVLPDGFAQTSNVEWSRGEVAGSLGDVDEIDALLAGWGWNGNFQRQFERDPATVTGPDQTIVLYVSVHRFDTAEGAQQAYPFFTQKAEELTGLALGEGPGLGDQTVWLIGGDAGANTVSVYILRANVVIRVYGYSQSGQPQQDVVDVATKIVARLT